MKSIGGSLGGQCEDLFGERRVKSEWESLCLLWKGVRGLRLFFKGSLGRKKNVSFSEIGWQGMGMGDGENLLDVRREWVVGGLLRLVNLRYLEVEVEDVMISREIKLGFCGQLEEAFNSVERIDGWEEVKVLFVERTQVCKENYVRDSDREAEPGDEVRSLDL